MVDDSEIDVQLLRSAMAACTPLDLTVVHNGRSALELMPAGCAPPFDVIIVDWKLPDMQGGEVARWFLNGTSSAVPVVVCSSGMPPREQSSLSADGAIILNKPIDLDGYESLARKLTSLARAAAAS